MSPCAPRLTQGLPQKHFNSPSSHPPTSLPSIIPTLMNHLQPPSSPPTIIPPCPSSIISSSNICTLYHPYPPTSPPSIIPTLQHLQHTSPATIIICNFHHPIFSNLHHLILYHLIISSSIISTLHHLHHPSSHHPTLHHLHHPSEPSSIISSHHHLICLMSTLPHLHPPSVCPPPSHHLHPPSSHHVYLHLLLLSELLQGKSTI